MHSKRAPSLCEIHPALKVSSVSVSYKEFPTITHPYTHNHTHTHTFAQKVMGKLWSSQAFTFVADHTPAQEEGLLPGLCLYTELWLAKVCLIVRMCVCMCVCVYVCECTPVSMCTLRAICICVRACTFA